MGEEKVEFTELWLIRNRFSEEFYTSFEDEEATRKTNVDGTLWSEFVYESRELAEKAIASLVENKCARKGVSFYVDGPYVKVTT